LLSVKNAYQENTDMSDHLKTDISRLCEELICASEANQSFSIDIQRMQEALQLAEQAFQYVGDTEMAQNMVFGRTGHRAHSTNLNPPSSRKVA